jgi:hypothetical protein
LEQPGIVGTYLQRDLIFKYAIALHALALEKKGHENERLDQKAQAYLEQSLSTRNYVPRHDSIFYVASRRNSPPT